MAVDDAGGTAPDRVDAARWDEIVAAAHEEGSVVVYTSQFESDVLFKEFEQAYPGITVTPDRQPTGDLLPRLDQEIQAGARGADVAFHTQVPWFEERGQQGSLAPLQLSPAVAEAGGYDDVGRYVAPVLKYPFFMAYNSTVAPPASTIEEIVTNAEAGNISVGLLDPASSIAIKNQFQRWEEVYPGILERIARLNAPLYGSTSQMSQSMAAGEIGYSVGQIPGPVAALREQGAPVEEIIPRDPAVTGAEDDGAVLATAPHPNAAQVFVNWLMSRELQQRFVDTQAPIVSYLIPAGGLTFDGIDTYDPAAWPTERQDEFMRNWNATFGH